MQPRKDYDDYLKFVNDTYSAEMLEMMSTSKSAVGGGKSVSGSRNSLLTPAITAPNKVQHNRTQS